MSNRERVLEAESNSDCLKKCLHCGIFVRRERWVKKTIPQKAYPCCAKCAASMDDGPY